MSDIKYVHTNLISKDWKKLAKFYIDVFNCRELVPKRNMKGKWIEDLTNIEGVHVKGIHLKLPGYTNGPTLEIFEYNKSISRNTPIQINEPGFTHIAFLVDDVPHYVDKILAHGGSFYGEITQTEIIKVGHITVVYMRDPEGNIVELQNWKSPSG